jgi:hypothetical protein
MLMIVASYYKKIEEAAGENEKLMKMVQNELYYSV